MPTIQELLQEIKEDKFENNTTTSFKFKTDVWEFFQGFEDKVAVEFGTHKGQTARILSYLFKTVHTVNNNDNEKAKELNSDRSNIHYYNFDLYSEQVLPIQDQIAVFLIDAAHYYETVILDINRATSMNCEKDCYIIFDDFGLDKFKDTVKRAVQTAVEQGVVEIVKYIGHEPGTTFDGQSYLTDREGVITKVIWR